jgi:glycosyltransferase involved in cell wall biosynthesis
MKRLCAEGWQVAAIGDFSDTEAGTLRGWGVEPFPVKLDAAGTSLVRDARYISALLRLYRRVRPTVVHHFSIKPVVYGSLAARVAGVPHVVNSVTGLGTAYSSDRRWLSLLVRGLYRLALGGRGVAVFQNGDDLERFVSSGLVRAERAVLVPGSGVDTQALTPETTLSDGRRNTFIMVSRMLWSKGVADFVDAARTVRQRCPDAKFLLIGGAREDYGSKNSDFVPRDWLEQVSREGVVDWLGWTPPGEVESWMRRSAAVVHPSYYPEGVPRSLIEAAAAGAPIVTTDTPGCRDTVQHGISGYLCPARCPDDLAEAMVRIIEDPDSIERMGREGRRLAVERFDEKIVLDKLLALYVRL